MSDGGDEWCDTCRFFAPFFDDGPLQGTGICRRMPPRPKSRETVDYGIKGSWWADWPVVAKNDWCGEWGALR